MELRLLEDKQKLKYGGVGIIEFYRYFSISFELILIDFYHIYY